MNFSKIIGSKAHLAIATLVMASSLLLSVPLPAAYAFVQGVCGQTITSDTTLTADITCVSNTPGIIIGASSITLDCAGHTISNALGPFNPSTNPLGSNQAGVQVASPVTTLTGVVVVNCHVTGFAVGIGLANTNSDIIGRKVGPTIEGNTVSGNGVGIALQAASSNSIRYNTASSNKNDGFLIQCGFTGAAFDCATKPAAGNIVKHNTADSNGASFGGFGYDDKTSGGKTAGTANTYKFDECSLNLSGGSSPTGLCTPQP